MGSIKGLIEKQVRGVYVKSLEIGSNVVEVRYSIWIKKTQCHSGE